MLKKIILLLILLIVFIGTSPAQNKTALVIGNSEYQYFPKLQQPMQEAMSMKAALERIGFDVVYVTDGSYDRMYDALAVFEQKLKQRGGIALFHFGGHGIQVNGGNYLLPVDKDIPDERRVRSRAMNASEVVDLMAAAGSTTNIIILDACRDNPLPAQSRSAKSRGLAILHAPVNTVVVYSAEAGETAEDGVFTPTLLEYLESPGWSFTEVLRKTRRAVYEKTDGRQTPGAYDQLFEPVFLAGRSDSASMSVGPVNRDPGSLIITVIEAGTLEINGQTVRVPAGGSIPVNGLEPGRYTVTMQYFNGDVETKTVEVQSGRSETVVFSYRRQAEAPEGFVLVEAGSFIMGAPLGERGRKNDERQHTVRITRDYYISRYEVTQEEYLSIMGSLPVNQNGINDNYPVAASWYDAVEYCNKLSLKEGLTPCYSGSGDSIRCDFNANGYRLPTEAEWEYAARGGHEAGDYNIYAGSDNIKSVAWYGYTNQTYHPVGQKEPNELGLYDMSGNEFEWCWDWYGEYPVGDAADPTGPSSGSKRVRRGGCSGSPAEICRIAARADWSPSGRLWLIYYYGQGFRVVRSLSRE